MEIFRLTKWTSTVWRTIMNMGNGRILNRFIIQYAKSATITLNYSLPDKKIIYDHIAPNGDALEGFANYVPMEPMKALRGKKGKMPYRYDRLQNVKTAIFLM